MKKIKQYVQEAYSELMTKVSWPTYSELQSSAIIVLVASFIIGMIIWLMDASFSNLLKAIYNFL